MSATGEQLAGPDAPEMDCIDFLPLVDELVESGPAQWEARILRHLTDCPPCRIFLEQLIDLRWMLREQADEVRLLPTDSRIQDLFAHAVGTREETTDDRGV